MVSSNRLFLFSLFITLLYSICNAAELTLRHIIYDTDIATTGAGDGSFTQVGSTYTATISFGGVSGTVNEAYLYWYELTINEVTTSSITFNGQTIIGNDIGIGSTNCLGSGVSQVFLADITSFVTGAPTSYTISDIPPATISPKASFRNTHINGFSLVVFFDDGDDSNNNDVVLYDGNDSNIESPYDPAGWNIILEGIQFPASGTAGLELHISDGQSYSDGSVVINGNSQTLTANGNQGNLFDIVNFDVTGFMTPSAENTLTITHTVSTGGDCWFSLSAIVVLVILPAGAAPIECFDTTENNPCTPENIAAHKLYFPSCSSCCHFIQCDVSGRPFEHKTFDGTYWNDEITGQSHNLGECTDDGCTLSPEFDSSEPAEEAAVQVHNMKPYDNPLIIQPIGDHDENVNYYSYILLIGVIAFILVNNVFIGCFCLKKHRNKQYIGVNDMDEI
eukprot:889559_1